MLFIGKEGKQGCVLLSCHGILHCYLIPRAGAGLLTFDEGGMVCVDAFCSMLTACLCVLVC